MNKLCKSIISIIKKIACLIIVGISSLVFATQPEPATDDILQTKLAAFSLQNQPNVKWIDISAIDNKPESFIALADNNQIFSLSPTGLSLAFSAEKILSEQAKVTAFSLHPNYSIRDQNGYLTLYIAHSEPMNNTRKFARVIDSSQLVDGQSFSHDLVITEWQMLAERNEIDISSKREVMRIGVPSEKVSVSQLAFNPYTKMWNDDFGLLFVALKHDENFAKSPLYSGAVLRINPLAFGLKGYTAPINNPFINQGDVNDEIFMTGAQDIVQFIWPNKEDNQLLISHIFNNAQQLSLSQGKDDWRGSAPQTVVWKTDKPLNNNAMVSYRGKALSHLWGRVLVVNQQEGHWQLLSMLMPSQIGEMSTPTLEWQLPASAKIKPESGAKAYGLFTVPTEELALFDFTTNNLSVLSLASVSEEVSSDSEGEQSEEELLNNSITKSSWLLILVVCGLIIWAFRFNQKKCLSAKFIVRQQYAHLEVSESKQQIGLYRRHQQNAEVVLTIIDIKQCIIALNGTNICQIDAEHGFDDAKEIDLREYFSRERREKMVPEKLRQLTINLIDDKKAHYPICIYLRKGDHRVTRKSYGDVIEDLLDWCWLYASMINPDNTGVRQPPAVKPSQHDITHDLTPKTTTNINPSAFKSRPEDKPVIKEEVEPVAPIQTEHSAASNNTSSNQSTIDAELVNALDKLVKLKEQGYLSDGEFNAAKTKLLKDLMS